MSSYWYKKVHKSNIGSWIGYSHNLKIIPHKNLTDYKEMKSNFTATIQADTTLIKRSKLTPPVMGKMEIMYHIIDAVRTLYYLCDITTQEA